MKNIHPKYFDQAKVVCTCGRVFTVGSTNESIRVEVCSACHPFFTGQSKFVDTQGRVERFKRMVDAAGRKRLRKASE